MQKVQITLKSTQEVDDITDSMELITDGQMELGEGYTLLTYRETDEQGEGLMTAIRVDWAQHPLRVDLDRTGTAQSHMTVQQGHRHHSLYSMGPCEFSLGVYGERVDCRLDKQGGFLKMQYTLDINAAYAGRNTVELFIEA